MRSISNLRGAMLLAFINRQKDGIEACIVKLRDPLLTAKEKGALLRKIRAHRRHLAEADLAPDIEKANREARLVRSVYQDSLDPNRKAKARAPNRGFKREKPPSPNGKNRGAYVVVRPKRTTK